MEQLDLGALQEGVGSASEVSEEDRKRVQKDWKKAFAAHQAVKKDQQANVEFSNFMVQVVTKFFDYTKVIEYLFDYLDNPQKSFPKLKIIFQPILDNKFSKVGQYIEYLQAYKKELWKKDINLIFEVIKSEKIWTNWDNLKAQNKYNEFIQNIETELKKILS